MKIIQTLWLPENDKQPINNDCGWLSPEYNWISWSLSFFQLKKFYKEVELFANKRGRNVLIDLLELPYSKVHELPDDLLIPSHAWALSKVITYSMQDEPFLHVDGDVFIYSPLPEELLKDPLIAQSIEVGFENYKETLKKVKESFQYVPSIFSENNESQTITYNAGIFGGSDIGFFKEYSNTAIDFVLKNQEDYHKINEPPSSYCMLFEQFLFSAMVKKAGKEVNTLFKDAFYDPGYPGFSDFFSLKEKNYIHFMGLTKKNRFKVKQLMNKFRQEYPQFYYKILRSCLEANLSLDFKVYSLPELHPFNHTPEYYTDLIASYYSIDKVVNKETNWKDLYAKDAFIFDQIEAFFQLNSIVLQQQMFSLAKDVVLKEVSEPEYKVFILINDTYSLETIELQLENLEIILLATLEEESKNIETIMEEIKPYFDPKDYQENNHLLLKMVLEKIKELMYKGAISWDRGKKNEMAPNPEKLAQALPPITFRN